MGVHVIDCGFQARAGVQPPDRALVLEMRVGHPDDFGHDLSVAMTEVGARAV